MSATRRPIYCNPAASKVTLPDLKAASLVAEFHHRLPSYLPTPLVPLDGLAKQLGVKGVFVKDEGNRLGLPSFKILGASWGTFRAIASKVGLPLNAHLNDLSKAASESSVKLFAATDGNHGRAVAYMAKLLQLPAEILVPMTLEKYTRELIASEGADVTIIQGDYDASVQCAARKANSTPGGLLIQDTSFDDYEDIPSWIVDGYSTMLHELDSQLSERGIQPTVIITPAGVGSLAQAVVCYAKSGGRSISTLAVEPDTAPCLYKSLKAGRITPIKTFKTIMDGLNCGTVSYVAWPVLQTGVDASVTVSDFESHRAVQYLGLQGIGLGPCGAAGLAALWHVAATEPKSIDLGVDSVVIILGTEGPRPYPIPIDVSPNEPLELAQLLVQINSSTPGLSPGTVEKEAADYTNAWFQHRDLETYIPSAMPG